MNVFLSWAGQPSKELASLLRDFLQVVVQECSPWMSEHDILAGQPWDHTLEAALKQASFGVLCITPENLGNAYLHYEAGAIANQVSGQNLVCPLLLGHLTASQLGQPLGRFQGKPANQKGIWELVHSLNSIAEKPLDATRLRRAFDGQWSQLERSIAGIDLGNTVSAIRSSDNVLDEILQHVRTFAASINDRRAAPAAPRSVKRAPSGLFRLYPRDIAGRIYPTMRGTFQWSLEDTKAKVVFADGETTTIQEAKDATDAAANVTPLSDWQME